MRQKKVAPLPFLTTHLANIALNKLIGLVFILSKPQEISGLTEVSHESLTNDQLAVGKWMILHFLLKYPEAERAPAEPWIELEPYRIKGLKMPAPGEMAPYERVIGQISQELQSLGDDLWSASNPPARSFLLRLVAQIEECERYTTRRVEVIKLCDRLGEVDHSDNPVEHTRIMLSLGPEMANELMASCGMLGVKGIGPIGYLAIKNSLSASRLFACRLLPIVQRVLTAEAVKRGYLEPPAA